MNSSDITDQQFPIPFLIIKCQTWPEFNSITAHLNELIS